MVGPREQANREDRHQRPLKKDTPREKMTWTWSKIAYLLISTETGVPGLDGEGVP